jgi:hypothetical protein
MNLIKQWMYLPAGLCIIGLLFVAASLFDIVLASIYTRFYSTAAFIVVFGVAGIFAAVLCYGKSIAMAPFKNEFARWSVIIMMWITALLFIFLFSVLEGGEYEVAFISYGVTLALSALFFVKDKIEL